MAVGTLLAEMGGRRQPYLEYRTSLNICREFYASAQMVVGLNGGAHANPCTSGDTIRAWSEVLDKAETSSPGVGAIRLRLVATKGGRPFDLRGDDGRYLPEVLLDLDYWALMPT